MRRNLAVVLLIGLGCGVAWGHGGGAAHNQADEAIKKLSEVLAESPDDVKARLDRGHLLLTLMEEWDEGLADFEYLVQLRASGNARIGPRTFEAIRTSRAIGHLKTGDLKAALSELDELCAAKSEIPVVWLTRGEVRLQIGDAAGAKADFDAAIAIKPWPLAHVRRAQAEIALKDDAAAMADFAAALKLEPRHLEALCVRSLYELDKGERAQAGQDVADAAQAAQPEVNPMVEATRTHLFAAQGFKLEAKGFANTAIGLWTADLQATRSPNRRAWLLLQTARTTAEVQGAHAALPFVEQALALAPDRPDLHREKVRLLGAIEGVKPETLAAAKAKLAAVEAARVPLVKGDAAAVASPSK